MKKLVYRSGAVLATVAVIVAGAAAFSAFEAHVVNVTATIQNALSVPVEAAGLSFGAVFPEEVLHKNLGIQLSDSFVGTTRVDDVEYMIRQKPKCQADSSQNPVQFAQVTDVPGVDGHPTTFACPTGYHQMSLLCPFLSKHELGPTGAPLGNGIDAFHGPLTGWTMADTIASQVTGRLSKQDNKTSANWDIDLHAPCFKGQCAQDNVVPASYQPEATLNGSTFGCDLWVEATGISACTVQHSTDVVSDTSNIVEETASSSAVALTPLDSNWTAVIPGATWIWSTNPVASPTTQNDTKTFDKTFTVTGTVGTAALDIATDNFYTVYVNGVQVGSEQAVENNFQSATQDHFVVTNLVSGSNTIRIVATNKGLAGSTPESNPAGVLYKLTYTTTQACK